MIESISAITLATHNMPRAVRFYRIRAELEDTRHPYLAAVAGWLTTSRWPLRPARLASARVPAQDRPRQRTPAAKRQQKVLLRVTSFLSRYT
jgi:hypothetical protein